MLARTLMMRLPRTARAFSAGVPATMKAAVIREVGPAEVMKVETAYPVPELKDGQVLVRNKFAGINFIDTYHRKGLYKRDLPFVGGQEGGGEIAAVSPKAEAMGHKVGDRVAYSILQTYSQYSAVPADKLLKVPDGVGLDVATACVVQGLTAHYLTHDAHAQLIQPGEWCLIHGVGGGTCQWAAQMAKIRGYKVIGTVAKGKKAIAEQTGCDELIVLDEVPGKSFEDYTSVDVVAKVMEITNGKGVKAAIDGIGAAPPAAPLPSPNSADCSPLTSVPQASTRWTSPSTPSTGGASSSPSATPPALFLHSPCSGSSGSLPS